ncbi:MAG: iron-containing alcohol dehydrogenase [Clostridia bacterium]|nr:iron-containing alcohol dehydrogenase [Clostridia bacterium]
MQNFEYYNPVHVVFGPGSVLRAGEIVKNAGGQHALIVSYKNSHSVGSIVQKVCDSLEEKGVKYTRFEEVTANPLISQARAGIKLCEAEGDIDIIVGVGGGSVMDCAKVIAAGVLYGRDIYSMFMFSHSDIKSINPVRALPTVMIPTLPATGSEMNPTAVITDDETRKKSYVWEPSCLYPKAAILDPELTVSLPPYQTAAGSIDILAHVAESYLNPDPLVSDAPGGAVKSNLDLQDGMQEGVMKAVLKNLEIVYRDPGDLQARGVLMWAASIGLNGWLTSGTFGFTPMHQMGHVLSAVYNATHGATLCCMMRAWCIFMSRKAPAEKRRYTQFARRILGVPLSRAGEAIEQLGAKYGVETHISRFGATAADIDRLTDDVVKVSFGPDGFLNSNPKMSREDIREIYMISL